MAQKDVYLIYHAMPNPVITQSGELQLPDWLRQPSPALDFFGAGS
jgi:hypothetical protein